MRIQTLSGKATQVRHSPLTATFRIGVRPVSVNFHQVVHIEEGDDVKVAGRMSKGILHAYAYNNITTGAKGNMGLALYYVGLLFWVFIDIYLTIWMFITLFSGLLLILIPMFLIVIPLCFWSTFQCIREIVFIHKSIQAVG